MVNFLLYALIILSLATQGTGECSVKDMCIQQRKMNNSYVNQNPVWNVTISNNCYCSQTNVRIGCEGFRTVKQVDPERVMISGGKGLVNGGQPIYPYASIGFTYAWSVPSQFKILSSQVVCS